MEISKNLSELIGKPCTVFTTQINRNFKEESPKTYPSQVYCYFTGILQEINSDIIVLQQLITGLKTILFLQHVVGISEEQILYPDDPEDNKTINEIKQKQSEFIDPSKMAEMLKNIKERK